MLPTYRPFFCHSRESGNTTVSYVPPSLLSFPRKRLSLSFPRKREQMLCKSFIDLIHLQYRQYRLPSGSELWLAAGK